MDNTAERHRSAPIGPTEVTDDNELFDLLWVSLMQRENQIHDEKRKRYTGAGDPLQNYLTTSDWIAKLLEESHPDAAEFVRQRGAMFGMMGRIVEKMQRLFVMVGQKDFLASDQGTCDKCGQGEGIEDTFIDISVISKLMAIETQRVRPPRVTND